MAGTTGKAFLNMMAFIAFIGVGVAMILRLAFGPNDVGNAVRLVAEILAYITIAFYAFYYAQRKWGQRQIFYIIAWSVAAVIIVLTLVLNILNVR